MTENTEIKLVFRGSNLAICPNCGNGNAMLETLIEGELGYECRDCGHKVMPNTAVLVYTEMDAPGMGDATTWHEVKRVDTRPADKTDAERMEGIALETKYQLNWYGWGEDDLREMLCIEIEHCMNKEMVLAGESEVEIHVFGSLKDSKRDTNYRRRVPTWEDAEKAAEKYIADRGLVLVTSEKHSYRSTGIFTPQERVEKIKEEKFDVRKPVETDDDILGDLFVIKVPENFELFGVCAGRLMEGNVTKIFDNTYEVVVQYGPRFSQVLTVRVPKGEINRYKDVPLKDIDNTHIGRGFRRNELFDKVVDVVKEIFSRPITLISYRYAMRESGIYVDDADLDWLWERLFKREVIAWEKPYREIHANHRAVLKHLAKTGRGGARKGAGRHPVADRRVTTSFKFSSPVREKLSVLATSSGISRAKVLEGLVMAAKIEK